MRKRSVAPIRPAEPLAVEVRLRSRFQLTLPEAVATTLAATPDDRLLFEADPTVPGVVRLRKARRTWAGSLPGVFGTEREFAAFVREERASWAGATAPAPGAVGAPGGVRHRRPKHAP